MKQKKKENDKGSLADRMNSAGIGRGENTSKTINWSKIKKVSSDDKPDQFWNGYCPESELNGKKVRMRLNKWDFYESEETGLQICINAPGIQAVILNFRGAGQFRKSENYADEVVVSEFLSPQNIDRFPFNEPIVIFKDREEKEAYIKSIK